MCWICILTLHIQVLLFNFVIYSFSFLIRNWWSLSYLAASNSPTSGYLQELCPTGRWATAT